MMKRGFLLAALVAATALSGCYKVDYVDIAPNASPGEVHTVWAHGVIYGVVMLSDVNAKELCGADNVYDIETKVSFLNGLVMQLTFGLYSPATATVTCKS